MPEMLRVASNALIVPPFECAWLSLCDYGLDGAFCLQFDCKGENDVTIILKPIPGAKRWQHLQRQQGPAGGEHILAVEENYTVILGSHRNSKLKIEKNGDEKASATALPGCTVNPMGFTSCWINYSNGLISVGTGPAGSSLSFQWQDPEPPILNIRHIGLSCWDKHVSYRNVQLLQPLPAANLQQLQQQALQLQQAAATAAAQQKGKLAQDKPVDPQQQQHGLQQGYEVPSLLQLVMDSVIDSLAPAAVFHVLHLSELLLPRTQQLYDAAVRLAGRWFELLVKQHVEELAGLSLDVMADILHEPLLDVSELLVFKAVAAWCQYGSASQEPQKLSSSDPAELTTTQPPTAAAANTSAAVAGNTDTAQQQQQQQGEGDELQHAQAVVQQQGQQQWCLQCPSCGPVLRPESDVAAVLQLVRFAFMSEADRQVVLGDPFTQQCLLVQQCLQEDLARLRESNGSTSPEGCYTFEQRRLVRPAAAAAAGSAAGAALQPLQEAAIECSTCSAATHGRTAAGGPSGSNTSSLLTCPTCSCPAEARTAVGSGQAAGAIHSGGSSSTSYVTRLGAAESIIQGQGGSSSSSSGGRGRAVGWRQYRRRLAPSCKELMYMCDGDRNGVIHYIATDYGTKQWVNPVLSKALDIKASSPPSRYTDPKALVSGQFLNTSFAGPRYIRSTPPQQQQGLAGTAPAPAAAAAAASTQAPSTWWQLDLGPQHRLLCNYYTIRHDGSQEGFARSWVLQGSNDLQHWLDLRRHQRDTTIRLPGQYGSWPITGPAASMPFRAFRLLLLGPTTSSTSPWAFCLSYWELYGYFYKLQGDGGVRAGGKGVGAAEYEGGLQQAGQQKETQTEGEQQQQQQQQQ